VSLHFGADEGGLKTLASRLRGNDTR
jgi:hypothetical protein